MRFVASQHAVCAPCLNEVQTGNRLWNCRDAFHIALTGQAAVSSAQAFNAPLIVYAMLDVSQLFTYQWKLAKTGFLFRPRTAHGEESSDNSRVDYTRGARSACQSARGVAADTALGEAQLAAPSREAHSHDRLRRVGAARDARCGEESARRGGPRGLL